MPDCQICLVCLDKRFFDNRYMTGAMCAKKRCNNATSIELPAAQNADLRLVPIFRFPEQTIYVRLAPSFD
ncbi:unnamed protein product [Gongylonema pulchrum]|uniref:CXXC-type domain-containing protein n=1 Tax=Gongylonema pulchrum TaxID=637853 RepID=A0A183DMA3_9BILA|nr:unnamed protein product [Gongylonema pulchrum]